MLLIREYQGIFKAPYILLSTETTGREGLRVMDKFECFFCEREPKVLDPAQGVSGYFYNCPFCGKYILESDVETIFRNKYDKKRHLVAGYLHSLKGQKRDTEIIDINNYESYIENEVIPKTMVQKLDRMLIVCIMGLKPSPSRRSL